MNHAYEKWLEHAKKEYTKIGMEIEEIEYGRLDIFLKKKRTIASTLNFSHDCGMLFISMNGYSFQRKIKEQSFLQKYKCKEWEKVTRDLIEELAAVLELKAIVGIEREYADFDTFFVTSFNKAMGWFEDDKTKGIREIKGMFGLIDMYEYGRSIYKELKKGFMDDMFDKIILVLQTLSKVGKSTTEGKFDEHSFVVRKECAMSVYHEGAHQQLKIEYKNDQFLLEYNTRKEKMSYELKDELDIEKAIEYILNDMETKQRIKNISNPPQYHFNNSMIELSQFLSLEAQNKLYELLIMKINPQEVEEKCATSRSYVRKDELKEYQGVSIFPFLDYFVAVKEDQIGLFEQNEEEKMKEEIAQMIVQGMKKEIGDTIKDLFV